MGGERTAVSAETTDVFLEAAFFAPDAVLGRARRLGLLTDASQRFERGVDPDAAGTRRGARRRAACIDRRRQRRARSTITAVARAPAAARRGAAAHARSCSGCSGVPLTDDQ